MEDSILPGFLKSYESLDQSRGGVVGGWRGLLGRLPRRVSTPTSEGDHEDSVRGLPVQERTMRALIVHAASS
ncbi:hypothetical protein FOFC_07545 [Fusarium oxysporum]|nr:hypothetical protein FOFC_07545 [Fusarium oxysporum]